MKPPEEKVAMHFYRCDRRLGENIRKEIERVHGWADDKKKKMEKTWHLLLLIILKKRAKMDACMHALLWLKAVVGGGESSYSSKEHRDLLTWLLPSFNEEKRWSKRPSAVGSKIDTTWWSKDRLLDEEEEAVAAWLLPLLWREASPEKTKKKREEKEEGSKKRERERD